jgi:hypothetical protein
MKRLRHPITSIREPFGKAGLIVACLALIAALGGTAFAAAKLNGTQKKEVEKIAKKFQGTGPAGPQGSAGANGKDGSNGTNGKDGANGANGANGKSVLTATLNPGQGGCSEGGLTVEVEGSGVKKSVCNGEEGEEGEQGEPGTPGTPGAPGPQGEPWTVGNVLPPNAVETGSWYASGSGTVYTPISFPIAMAAGVKAAHVFFGTGEEAEIEVSEGVFEKTEFQKHCPGLSYKGPLVANPGELCVYVNGLVTTEGATFASYQLNQETAGAAKPGALLKLEFPGPGEAIGSFAVKGCKAEEPNKTCP